MQELSKQLLKSLGLSDSQVKVYAAALELGEANMQELSEKSGVKRTSIYNFIEELKERGLMTETRKRKRRVYSAVHPAQLLEIEKTRIGELERVLPELLAIHNRQKTKPRVTFYEGMDRVLEVYTDQLREKKPIFAYEDLEHMVGSMPDSFLANWPMERAKKNIPFASISRDSEVARAFTKKNIKFLRRSKLVKANDWKTEINIYGNKVAMMTFRPDHPICVLIEDKDIAETMRANWQMFWDALDVPVIG
ncbi:MAG: helix-turn-helix domain-containing protein [Patescibacteria group bacterium]